MISSNTFCLELCYEDYTKYAEKHRVEIMEALLYIKENLPRTIVNLILSPSEYNLIIKHTILLLLINYSNLIDKYQMHEDSFNFKTLLASL